MHRCCKEKNIRGGTVVDVSVGFGGGKVHLAQSTYPRKRRDFFHPQVAAWPYVHMRAPIFSIAFFPQPIPSETHTVTARLLILSFRLQESNEDAATPEKKLPGTNRKMCSGSRRCFSRKTGFECHAKNRLNTRVQVVKPRLLHIRVHPGTGQTTTRALGERGRAPSDLQHTTRFAHQGYHGHLKTKSQVEASTLGKHWHFTDISGYFCGERPRGTPTYSTLSHHASTWYNKVKGTNDYKKNTAFQGKSNGILFRTPSDKNYTA